MSKLYLEKIKDKKLKLKDALKILNLMPSGADCKIQIQNKMVSLNNEICTMPNKQLQVGDVIEFLDDIIEIK